MKASILVVDDEKVVRQRLEDHLTAQGCHVATAACVTDALEAIRSHEFDLVITDLRMPDGDGMHLLGVVREEQPDTEVIILTAHGDMETALQCVRRGAFDFVNKSPRMEELDTAVARALERRRLRTATDLYRASQTIFELSNREDLPQRIVEVAAEVLGADDGALVLPTTDGGWYVVCCQGRVDEEAQALASRIARGVALSLKPALVTDDFAQPLLDDDAALLSESVTIRILRRMRSCIAYPLCSGTRLLGVLMLSRLTPSRAFRPSDLTRAGIVASQVVLALETQDLMRRLLAAERFTTVGQMAASIAHDINNPISYVLTNVSHARGELAARGQHPDVCAALEDAEEGARRVADIVAEIRQVAGTQQVETAVFALGPVLQSALRMTSATVRGCADVRLAVDPGASVRGVPGRLCQVFMNLLVNAAHAVEAAGRGRGLVQVTCRVEGPSVVVEVSDNGVGIPPQNVARLFEPFFTTKAPGKGTGLGLSICRDIVRAHGGELSLRSTPGSGTTFVVRLAREPDAAPATTGPERAQPTPPSLKLRILCIDDEERQLRAYARELGESCIVVTESCPLRALQRLRQESYDVILCDVLMPGMTGAQLHRELTGQQPEMAGRFVFVTGSAGLSHESYLASVAVPVLTKPLAPGALQALLASYRARQAAG
ncbi:MAG: response regulator [Myxococcota bacterium]